MADAAVVNNRQLNEAMNAVRRLINDLDSDQPAVQDHMLRELLIAEFVMISHEVGWDPRTPTRPTTGAAFLTYSLGVGGYQTTLEGAGDVAAITEVTIDTTPQPLQFVKRAVLESWVNNDLKRMGAVQQGTPRFFTLEILPSNVSSATSEMKNRLWLYPATNEACTVTWPRTVIDINFVDPSGTGRSPFSYQVTYAWYLKSAAQCVLSVSDEGLKRMQLDRGAAQVFLNDYQAAVQREMAERAIHSRTNRPLELMA